MKFIKRVAVTSEPIVVFSSEGPTEVTVWVSTQDIDTEFPENSLVSVDDNFDRDYWQGAPLPMDKPITFFMEEGDKLWAKSNDTAHLSMTWKPWLGPSS